MTDKKLDWSEEDKVSAELGGFGSIGQMSMPKGPPPRDPGEAGVYHGKMPDKAEPYINRPEGVYCEWVTYPEGFGELRNLLKIERVNGNNQLSQIVCTREEAEVIKDAISNRGER